MLSAVQFPWWVLFDVESNALYFKVFHVKYRFCFISLFQTSLQCMLCATLGTLGIVSHSCDSSGHCFFYTI